MSDVENQNQEEISRTSRVAGHVVAVSGSVVDIAFKENALPAIGHAVEIPMEDGRILTIEVQQHIDRRKIRGVAMQETAGLGGGMAAWDTGGPIRVPAGNAVLGRLMNVIGDPIDRGGAFGPDVP